MLHRQPAPAVPSVSNLIWHKLVNIVLFGITEAAATTTLNTIMVTRSKRTFTNSYNTNQA